MEQSIPPNGTFKFLEKMDDFLCVEADSMGPSGNEFSNAFLCSLILKP